MFKKILFLLATLTVFSCENSTKNSNETLPVIKYMNNGLEREYLLYIPSSAKQNSPLVFVLHGLGSTNTTIMNYSQMNKVAEKNGFAVCYPQGSKSSEKSMYTEKGSPFWNVGYEIHKNEKVDDLDFIISLAKHLQKKYGFDPEKTFCSGMSNGGDMSYLLGCQAPDIFQAIAPITGCMMGWIYESCDQNNPVPVFQVHGTADNTTYYNGDEDNSDKWGAYMGVEKSIALWAKKNKCETMKIDTLPDTDPNDGSIVVTYKYSDGINGNQVWFYKVINGNHEWPPGWPQQSGNGDLNTSEEIWKFFMLDMKNRGLL